MAEIKLDPVIGELSPNIYKAAQDAGLPLSQQKQLSQLAYARKEAKRLLQLSEQSGREEFLKFDSVVQDNIRYLYGKEKTKSFRKMGHVTVRNTSLLEAKAIAKKVQGLIKIKA